MSEKEMSQDEMVDQIYGYAADLKKAGQTDLEIINALQEKGLDADSSKTVVDNLNNMIAERQAEIEEEEGGSGMGWLVWIGILILVNVLSFVFDWGFIIY